MSEIRLNVIDAIRAIHDTVHGSIGDAVIASLSAEPETVGELETALDRFNKRLDEQSHFDLFVDGKDFRPWDAGVIIVDLAARIVAVESSYSAPEAQGEINYHDGTAATDLSLPYVLPADWLFISSIDEYESLRDERLIKRRAEPQRDIRQVLYGRPLIDFIVLECLFESDRTPEASGRHELRQPGRDTQLDSAGQLDAETNVQHLSPPDGESRCDLVEADDLYQFDDPVVQALHIRWLMTPRADLDNRTPREVILEKQSFLALDLWSREMQWSFLREGPPPLSRESYAYRFAGIGPHEFVIYYYLVRYLLIECWDRVRERTNAAGSHAPQPSAQMDSLIVGAATAPIRDSAPQLDQEALRQWLDEIKECWLNETNEEFDGRAPIALIESERRRIPLLFSAKQMILDEDCELCRMLADDTHEDFSPAFWHLDGCNMDPGFEFSHYQTREEWDAEEARMRELDLEFERERKAEQAGAGTERSVSNDEMIDDLHDF